MSCKRTAVCGTPTRIILSAFVAACLEFAPSAGFGVVTTSGGTQTGVKVCREFTEKNNSNLAATDLHFKAWQKEDDREINGWEITIDCCNAATSARGTQPDNYNNDGAITHAVDVSTSPGDCTVPPGGTCEIKICFWLTQSNAISMDDFTWTYTAAPEKKGEPNNGFWIGCPTRNPPGGSGNDTWGTGDWRHLAIFENDDASRSIRIRNLGFAVDAQDFPNLIGTAVTPGPNSNILVGPGQQYRIDVLTPEPSLGQFVYATWSLTGQDQDSVYAAAVALQHEIAACRSPRVPSLTEWGFILFGALILLTGVYYIWHRRKLVTA